MIPLETYMQISAISHYANLLLGNISSVSYLILCLPSFHYYPTKHRQLTFLHLSPSLDFPLGVYLLENSVAASDSRTCWKVIYSELLQTEVEFFSNGGEKQRRKNLGLARGEERGRQQRRRVNFSFSPVQCCNIFRNNILSSHLKDARKTCPQGWRGQAKFANIFGINILKLFHIQLYLYQRTVSNL